MQERWEKADVGGHWELVQRHWEADVIHRELVVRHWELLDVRYWEVADVRKHWEARVKGRGGAIRV